MDFNNLNYLVVGGGFWGATIAERLANDKKEHVVVIDKRDHIGGNSFSQFDSLTGIEYHRYGTHIFHTSKSNVWKYINRFTSFNGYRHQVLSVFRNRVYQMPITLETINAYYGTNFRPFEARRFIESEISKENISTPNNLEERAISQIGRPLYEAFIKGYTQKQWQEDPRFLPISIINRIPVRYDYNESYFFDQWQGIPTNDYTAIFKKMMTSARIDIHLGIDFFDVKRLIPDSCLVFYSGPIDRFFNYKYGKLGWRTLDFERDIIEAEDYQGTSVMNYPESSVPYIRIHEPRHLHTERDYPKDKTLIIKEYPRVNSGDNPYYPINAEENQIILKQYIEEKAKYPNVIFGGRLGDYQYYDMDQTIDMALSVYNNQIERRGRQL